VALPFQPPGGGHLFGTDRLGRDLWSQVLYGGRSLLVVPMVATVICVVVGTAVGMSIGYLRGFLEPLTMATVNVFLVMPPVIVVLVLANWQGGGALVIVMALLLTGSPFLALLIRATTLEITQAPFVQVGITQGDGVFAILWREVLPNLIGPVLAYSGILFVAALYLTSALSLLGFGPQVPETNWATMALENAEGAGLNLWALVLPALMIALLSISVNVTMQAFADRAAR
ncbi:MAG: ABC transporter permease, partial [Caldilineaceae bacterium]|nr:ABC transporter permease [Caldilineaceae bacterium]